MSEASAELDRVALLYLRRLRAEGLGSGGKVEVTQDKQADISGKTKEKS